MQDIDTHDPRSRQGLYKHSNSRKLARVVGRETVSAGRQHTRRERRQWFDRRRRHRNKRMNLARAGCVPIHQCSLSHDGSLREWLSLATGLWEGPDARPRVGALGRRGLGWVGWVAGCESFLERFFPRSNTPCGARVVGFVDLFRGASYHRAGWEPTGKHVFCSPLDLRSI